MKMPICNNPDCPHKLKTGSSPEYSDGITHCPDCNNSLMDNPTELYEKVEKTESDLVQKILITIGLLLFFRLLCLIPIPGVGLSGLPDNIVTRYFQSSKLSIVALGIMPYITAYFYVEIFSLVIPVLKRWRGEKQEGRRKLTLTARWLTLVLCLVQGIGLAISLSRMTSPDGLPLVANTGLGFEIMLIVTLTAGVFISLWIADMITSKGLGNGISMLLLTGLLMEMCSMLFSRFSHTYGYSNFMDDAVAILLILFAAGAFIVFMERGEHSIKVKLKNSSLVDLPFKYNPFGIIPATLAATVALMPLTIMNFIPDYHGFLEYFRPDNWAYYVTYAVVTVVLYFFFVSLYYDPGKIFSFLRSKNAEPVLPDGVSFEKLLDKKLTILTLLGSLYLIVYSVLLRPGKYIYILFSGLVLIKIVSITLDLINEVKARKEHGYFVKIDEIQKPYEAKFLKNLLEQSGIPCFLEGYYHRSLYYFFGPFVQISLYVQQSKEDEAFKIISDQPYTIPDSIIPENV